jgi:hypothetical protein
MQPARRAERKGKTGLTLLRAPVAVSQFTLLARTKKGTKPDFHGAANPEDAKRLYEYFVSAVKKEYDPARVADGRFQAMMEVALVNDGPVGSRCGWQSKCTGCYGTPLTLSSGYVGAQRWWETRTSNTACSLGTSASCGRPPALLDQRPYIYASAKDRPNLDIESSTWGS